MASEHSPPELIEVQISIQEAEEIRRLEGEQDPQPPFMLPPPEQIANIPRHLVGLAPTSQNKDANFTYIHMQSSRDADFFEDFCKEKLPADDIYVPPHLQPINPEDEDDVVPDQHAAFGIQKATQKNREPAWKDLGLAELMGKGPHGGGNGSGSGSGGGPKAGGRRKARGGQRYTGVPR